MSVHPIPGLDGLGVSIPGLHVGIRQPGTSGAPRTEYPSSGHRPVPPRVQTARRVQQVINAATGGQLDQAMATQLVATADHPDAYQAAKGLAMNLAASAAHDRASARERFGPGAYGPSVGSRLRYLFSGGC